MASFKEFNFEKSLGIRKSDICENKRHMYLVRLEPKEGKSEGRGRRKKQQQRSPHARLRRLPKAVPSSEGLARAGMARGK